MELRHLRYFQAIARESHVTRAAQLLGVAQPALTQQMRALETELGVTLWRKLGRGIELTEAGQVLFSETNSALQRIEDLVKATQKAGRGDTGQVVMGYIETASYTKVMTTLVSSCKQKYPGIRLEMVQDRTEGLIQALTRRAIDVALVRPPIHLHEGLIVETLDREELVAAVPHGHRLADRVEIAVEELADEEFICHARLKGRTGLHDVVEEACLRAGFIRKVAQHTPTFASTLSLVASSVGVAIVPSCMRDSRSTDVVYLRLSSKPPLISEIALVYRANERSPAVNRLAELAKSGAVI